MSFETYPIESEHAFSGPENEFLCSVCHRPRLLHYRYPFHPKPDPAHFFEGPYLPFRGPHTRFTKPGYAKRKDRDDEPIYISPHQRANAERIRKQERESVLKYVNR